ncbi:MAG: ABC transporter substrate-binding protein [Prosthecobacter sp.]|nr:ABC transporter substrate-binding protein [Prosthecobacter sp.]
MMPLRKNVPSPACTLLGLLIALALASCRKEVPQAAATVRPAAQMSTQAPPADQLVVRLPGPLPLLNPYTAADQAARQVLDLLHEPLLRYNREGMLAPALAEEWQWRQEMTCWFSSPEAAAEAMQHLQSLPLEQRSTWDLEAISSHGSRLSLRLTRPGGMVAADVGKALASRAPLRLAFLRILAPPSARLALESFAKDPAYSAHTHRLWFGEDGVCEMVSTLPTLQAQQALTQWLTPRHHPVPEIQIIDEASALVEPVLDFRLRQGVTWPDGSPVTLEDVRATLTQVLARPWPVAGKEAFQYIQEVTTPAPDMLRVTYRRAHSPALPAWTLLPILPAAWLEQHVVDFSQAEPPGAGPWRVARREGGLLLLEKRTPEGQGPPIRQIRLLAAQESTSEPLDLSWQPLPADAVAWQTMPLPASHQLMLIWHTEAPQLTDARVRQALSLALDRRALLEAMPGTAGRVHDGFFPPGYGFTPKGMEDMAPAPHAPERRTQALDLLKTAGWLRDVEGRLRHLAHPMRLRLVIPAENPDRQRLAAALSAQWREIGVETTVTEVPAGSYLMELQAGRFDVALVAASFTPGWDVLPWWHSSQRSGLGPNVSQLADPQLDLLLEALMTEFDPAQTPHRAAAVEARLRQLRPALPLFTDLTLLHLRQARFPGLAGMSFPRGCTLRDLLPALTETPRPQTLLRLRAPD